VYEEESSALAGELMTDICQREGIFPDQVTLHSDNGSPMKGATMLATLQELGVIPSFITTINAPTAHSAVMRRLK
jgi:hypothetical protein